MHDAWVHALMYADDGALVSTSPQDLQCMLDILRVYCSQWRLFVNISKTEVVVFNRKKDTAKSEFYYDSRSLQVVDKFKYLGVLFHENAGTQQGQQYKTCVEYRLKQATCLVASWLRKSEFWLFRPDVVINQFNTCILPALEYGVGLWGVGSYKSHIWQQIETFWCYIARTVLGVPIRSPSAGVYGELGWYPFWTRAAWQAVSMWTRITRMPSDALTRQAMHVQRRLFTEGKSCWLTTLKDTLCTTEVGTRYWNEWMNTSDFQCTCTTLVLDSRNPSVSAQRRWEDDCIDAFRERACSEWIADIDRP
jgi:hypothetical protein